MSIHDNINEGKYEVKFPYPEFVRKPEIFNRKLSELTPDEIKSLPKLAEDYNAALECEKKRKKEYREESARLEDEFRKDLLAEHGIDPDDELGQILYSRAWSDGHSHGYSNVASIFDDLAEIYDHVRKNYTRNKPRKDGAK